MKTILCIDDDSSILELRRRVLESSGYGVITAPSGNDGLKLVSQGAKVDLVLLDYLMPGMNGDEVVENLKSEFPALPVIAIVGGPSSRPDDGNGRCMHTEGPAGGDSLVDDLEDTCGGLARKSNLFVQSAGKGAGSGIAARNRGAARSSTRSSSHFRTSGRARRMATSPT